MKKKSILCGLIAFVLAFSLGLMGCAKDNTPTPVGPEGPPGPEPQAAVVTLSQTKATLDLFDELLLTATVENTDEEVVWASSDNAVATVSGGLVTAVDEGTANITASAGGATATCRIEVVDSMTAPVLVLDETEIHLGYGETYTLDATVLWKGRDFTDKVTAWTWQIPEGTDLATLTSNGGSATLTGNTESKKGELTLTVMAMIDKIDTPAIATALVKVHNTSISYEFVSGGAFNADQSGGNYYADLSVYATGDEVTTLDIGENIKVFERQPDGTLKEDENPEFTYSFEGDYIEIDPETNIVTAKAHTETAGPVTVTATYKDGDGLLFDINVYRPVLTLEQEKNYVLEAERLPEEPVLYADLTTTELVGTPERVTYDDVQVNKDGDVSTGFEFDASRLVKTTDVLGANKTFVLDTDKVHYEFAVDYYTLIIMDATDLDNMMMYAWNADPLPYRWGGYFLLGADIDYGTHTAAKDVSNGHSVAGTAENVSENGENVSANGVAGYFPRFMGYAAMISSGVSGGWSTGASGGFCGTFDGCGHKIDGLRQGYAASSVFGVAMADAIVKNVSFTNATIEGNGSLIYTGGCGKIEDVYVQVNTQTVNGGTNQDKTAIAFGNGASEGAKMTRVFIDTVVTEAYNNSFGIANVGPASGVLDEVYAVACPPDKAINLTKAEGTGTDKYGAYINWTAFADAKNDFTGWDNDFWNLVNGFPYPASLTAPTAAPGKILATSYIGMGGTIDFHANSKDVITVTAEKDGQPVTDFTVAAVDAERFKVTPGESVTAGTIFTITAKNRYATDETVETATVTFVTLTQIDATDVNLGEVVYADESKYELDLATKLADSDKLSGIDLSSLTVADVTYDGEILEYTYEGGVLGFGKDAGIAQLRRSGVYGDQTLTVTAYQDNKYYAIDIKATFISVIITDKSQMERETFKSYGDQLTKAQMAALGADGWHNVDGTTDMIRGYWVLGADVDVTGMKAGLESGYIVNPGCMASVIVNSTFDGRGHTIKGFKPDAGSHQGFFCYAFGTTVKDVTFIDADLDGRGGIVIDDAEGCTIENVAVYGTMSGTNNTLYCSGQGGGSLLVGVAGAWNGKPTTIKNVLGVLTFHKGRNLAPDDTEGTDSNAKRTGGIILGNKPGAGAEAVVVENAIAVNLVEGSDPVDWAMPAIGSMSGRTNLEIQNGGYETVHTFHGWQEYLDWAKANPGVAEGYYKDAFWAQDVKYDNVFLPIPENAKNRDELKTATIGGSAVAEVGKGHILDANGYYTLFDVTGLPAGVTFDAAERSLGVLDFTAAAKGVSVSVKSMLGDATANISVSAYKVVDLTGEIAGEVDYASEDSDGIDLGEKFEDDDRLGGSDITAVNAEAVYVNGQSVGATFAGGVLTFDADAKAALKAAKAMGETTVQIVTDGDVTIDVTLLAFIKITKADQLEETNLRASALSLTGGEVVGAPAGAIGVDTKIYKGYWRLDADIDVTGIRTGFEPGEFGTDFNMTDNPRYGEEGQAQYLLNATTDSTGAKGSRRSLVVDSVFDGNGHTITGLSTEPENPDRHWYHGGFIPLALRTTVKDLTVVNGVSGINGGLIVGEGHETTVENVAVYGKFTGSAGHSAWYGNSSGGGALLFARLMDSSAIKNCLVVMNGKLNRNNSYTPNTGGNEVGMLASEVSANSTVEHSVAISVIQGSKYAWAMPAIWHGGADDMNSATLYPHGPENADGTRKYPTVWGFHGWHDYLDWAESEENISDYFASSFWAKDVKNGDVTIPVPENAKNNAELKKSDFSVSIDIGTPGEEFTYGATGYYTLVAISSAPEGSVLDAGEGDYGTGKLSDAYGKTVITGGSLLGGEQKTAGISVYKVVDLTGESLADVNFASEESDTIDVSDLNGNAALDGLDLTQADMDFIAINGKRVDGAVYDKAAMTLTLDKATKDAVRAAGGLGETAVMLLLSSGDTYISLDVTATFASAIITDKSQMERKTFAGYADNLTKAEMDALIGEASWFNVDGYTQMIRGYWILAADVDVTGMTVGLAPGYSDAGGMGSSIINSGFDGRGHTIKGFTSVSESPYNASHQGFFNYAYNTTVKNVTFTDVDLTYRGGMVINTAYGCTIENVAVYGKYSGTIGTAYDSAQGSAGLVVGWARSWNDKVNEIRNVLAVITEHKGNATTGNSGGIIVGYTTGNAVVEHSVAVNLVEGTDPADWGMPGVNTMTTTDYDRTDVSQYNGGYDTVQTFHGWQEYLDWAKTAADYGDYFASSFWAQDVTYDGVRIPVPALAKDDATLKASTVTVSADVIAPGESITYDASGYYTLVTLGEGAPEGTTLDAEDDQLGAIVSGSVSGTISVKANNLLGGAGETKSVGSYDTVDLTGESAGEVDVASEDADQIALASIPGASEALAGYDLDSATLESASVNGKTESDIVSVAGGYVSFSSEQKAQLLANGHIGETDLSLSIVAGSRKAVVKIKVTLLAEIVSSDQMARETFLSYAIKLTKDDVADAPAWVTKGTHIDIYKGYWVLGADVDVTNIKTGLNIGWYGNRLSGEAKDADGATGYYRSVVVDTIFDGRGHTIKGLHSILEQEDQWYNGGFFPAAVRTTIRDLTVVDGNLGVEGGLLIGQGDHCTIEDVAVYAKYSGNHGTSAWYSADANNPADANTGAGGLIMSVLNNGSVIRNCLAVMTDRVNRTHATGNCYGIIATLVDSTSTIEHSVAVNMIQSADTSRWALSAVWNGSEQLTDLAKDPHGPVNADGSRKYPTVWGFHGWQAYVDWAKSEAGYADYFATDFWAKDTLYDGVKIPVPAVSKSRPELQNSDVTISVNNVGTPGEEFTYTLSGVYTLVALADGSVEGSVLDAGEGDYGTGKLSETYGKTSLRVINLAGGAEKTYDIYTFDNTVDLTGESLGDIDFASAESDTIDISDFNGRPELDGLDLTTATMEFAAVNGKRVDLEYAAGAVTFDAADKTIARGAGALGETTVMLLLENGDKQVPLEVTAIFASAVIKDSSQMERSKFVGYGNQLTKAQMAALGADAWYNVDGTTQMVSGYWILGADVDVTGMSAGLKGGYISNPGCMGSTVVNSTLDGRGHTIKGYKPDDDTWGHQGFFCYAFGLTIKNVTFIDANLTGRGGILIDDAEGCTIENVAVYGTMSGTLTTEYCSAQGGGSLLVGTAGAWNGKPTTIKNVLGVLTFHKGKDLAKDGTSGNAGNDKRTGGIILGCKPASGAAAVTVENAVAVNLVEGTDPVDWAMPAIGSQSGRTNLGIQNGGYDTVQTFHGWQEYITWAKGNAGVAEGYFASSFWAKDVKYDGVLVPVPELAKNRSELKSVAFNASTQDGYIESGTVNLDGYYPIATVSKDETVTESGYLSFKGAGKVTVSVKSMLGGDSTAEKSISFATATTPVQIVAEYVGKSIDFTNAPYVVTAGSAASDFTVQITDVDNVTHDITSGGGSYSYTKAGKHNVKILCKGNPVSGYSRDFTVRAKQAEDGTIEDFVDDQARFQVTGAGIQQHNWGYTQDAIGGETKPDGGYYGWFDFKIKGQDSLDGCYINIAPRFTKEQITQWRDEQKYNAVEIRWYLEYNGEPPSGRYWWSLNVYPYNGAKILATLGIGDQASVLVNQWYTSTYMGANFGTGAQYNSVNLDMFVDNYDGWFADDKYWYFLNIGPGVDVKIYIDYIKLVHADATVNAAADPKPERQLGA